MLGISKFLAANKNTVFIYQKDAEELRNDVLNRRDTRPKDPPVVQENDSSIEVIEEKVIVNQHNQKFNNTYSVAIKNPYPAETFRKPIYTVVE